MSDEFKIAKMKIYISGKISGIENQAEELFARAEKELLARGFQPVNPMSLNHNHDKSWHSYMREDVKALCECEAVYMLSNWSDSKGAIIEHTIAMYLGLKIHYQAGVQISF
jgi:hypothetical protein